ncbi:MAG: hypothetical protein J3K34DRAFT_411652 [Monoraphidium minutum]|nr:MAG: hypothetical protein J3K34DRAFT_448782 [Monoraphidium minutum]KAI8462792.1 MAG: hypothetical protein J3K34DRAFT_446452 [Monoraphidium minutum]KAI8473124.1 MAG: hypothetical protein J3K34DRAFT_411652 [Monoraphidium minutum]
MVHRAPAPREPAEAGSGGVKHGGRRALPVCQHAPLDALDHVLHDVGCLKLLPAPAPLAPQPPRRLEHCEAQPHLRTERRVQQHPREAAQLARQEPVARAPPNGAPLRAPLAVPRQRVGAVVVRRRGRRGGRRGLRRRSRRPLCAAHGAHQRGVARRRGVHPRRVVNRRQRGVELLPPPAAERAARPDALQPARLGRVHLQLPRRYFADFRGVGAVSGPAPQARRNSAAWRVEAGHVGRRTQSQQPQAGVAHAEAGERRVP